MSKAKELKKKIALAKEYVGKIGRPEHHFRPVTYGRLHSLSISTQIHHQESTGATNYWADKAFDTALAAVVSNRFPELAADAIALMERECNQALVAEKDELLARLAEIEALEKEAA